MNRDEVMQGKAVREDKPWTERKSNAYARGLPFSGLMIRITAVARGEVQGVGYRYFVTGCARVAGVTGYVKNQPDGSVLVVAEGERAALDAFVLMVKAEGDAVIRVDSLTVTPGEASGEFAGFGMKW